MNWRKLKYTAELNVTHDTGSGTEHNAQREKANTIKQETHGK